MGVINFRLHVVEVLREIAKWDACEVVVFSAGTMEYTDAVLSLLDPDQRLIHHRSAPPALRSGRERSLLQGPACFGQTDGSHRLGRQLGNVARSEPQQWNPDQVLAEESGGHPVAASL